MSPHDRLFTTQDHTRLHQRPFITVTGIDERVSLEDIDRLNQPDVELGFLYTFDREGRNRYIDRRWSGIEQLRFAGRAALHICGKRAREQLMLKDQNPFGGLGDPYAPWVTELGSLGGQFNLLRHVQRIQVNGIVSCEELHRICMLYPCHTIITQHMPGNEGLWARYNHAVLVDGSGGTGKSPESWVRPDTGSPVGFAGGLGPDNLAAELVRIKKAADTFPYTRPSGWSPPWWIDMESKLRVDDWFSVDRALECIRIFKANT